MASRYLPEMAWTQVKAYLDRGGDLAVIPLGSTENHGPHAPLGTDSIIAEELCRRLASRIDALIAPVVPLGYCPQHLPFPGSIHISNETLAKVVLETALCLESQGFRRFVLISGHGGNRVALDLAAGHLKQQKPHVEVLHAHVLAVQTSRHMREKVEAAYGKPLTAIWEAHGGEQETSAVMAVRPELVNLELAAPEPDVTAYLARGRDAEVFRIDYNLQRHAPVGNWGDPSAATPEEGHSFYDQMAEHIAMKISQKWDQEE